MNITQKTKAREKAHTSRQGIISSPCGQTLHNMIHYQSSDQEATSEGDVTQNHIIIKGAKHICCGFTQLHHHAFGNLTFFFNKSYTFNIHLSISIFQTVHHTVISYNRLSLKYVCHKEAKLYTIICKGTIQVNLVTWC